MLPNWRPVTVSMTLEELLITSSSAVDAVHHAEQSSAVTDLGYLRSHRGPNSVKTSIKAWVPNCSDLPGLGRLEKNDLLLGHCVPRIGASRCVLGAKD